MSVIALAGYILGGLLILIGIFFGLASRVFSEKGDSSVEHAMAGGVIIVIGVMFIILAPYAAP